MRESKGQNQNGIPSPTLKTSLQTLHDFLDAFPPDYLEERSWELISSALTSENSDAWSACERGDMLYFYEWLSTIGYALAVIDKKFWPMPKKSK